ncbi:MAG: 50S ribosomal protein L25/general stress protein Ctc [Candidatus Ancaeobacter aquaticus]|nr:50S ribosomal protein L25/general stress protein Ctc [Candidatus Ancaeobacter aquaticus]
MAQIELKVQLRVDKTKGELNDMRYEGLVPAIVYGQGKDPVMIQLNEREFAKVMRQSGSENLIIRLAIEGAEAEKEKDVILQEVQRHPIAETILHVDFHEISLKDKIKVNVPIHETGDAVGVEKSGGVLEHGLREIEVECLPTEIPEKIDIDISALEIGQALYVKDLPVTENVVVLTDPELPVFSVSAPKAEEEEKPAEEGETAEPEVIREKKPEGEEEEQKEDTK